MKTGPTRPGSTRLDAVDAGNAVAVARRPRYGGGRVVLIGAEGGE
ncbi:MAG: hypothetical protein OXE96_16180 [Gemmatimonadetes bacterium]|nr:hypothetical protein [Gemmatimonadota bacterium]